MTPAASPPPLKPLEITLSRSNNEEQDRQKLLAIHQILQQNPGNDYHVLLRTTSDNRPVKIEFPALHVKDSVALRQALQNLVGAAGLRAQE